MIIDNVSKINGSCIYHIVTVEEGIRICGI